MHLSNEPLLLREPVNLCTQQPATAARHMILNDFRRSFDRPQITEDDDVYLECSQSAIENQVGEQSSVSYITIHSITIHNEGRF